MKRSDPIHPAAEQTHDHAKLLRLTRECAALRADARAREARLHVLQYREHALRMKIQDLRASRSWRWTAPLRAVAAIPGWSRRRLQDVVHAYVHGGVALLLRKVAGYVARHLLRAKATPAPQAAPEPEPCPLRAWTDAATADVFMFGIIDWRFRTQRPQHLAREFARAGHRVFYFSNHFIDSDSPGFDVEHLDDALPLFQVRLKLRGAPAIYFTPPSDAANHQLMAGVRQFRAWVGTHRAWALVQHAFWSRVAMGMQFDCVAYDCMDHHGGFGSVAKGLLDLEVRLMRQADLLVTTSSWLGEQAHQYNSHAVTIRNAGDFEHFSAVPAQCFVDPRGRPIIGYYGAIAEWFDAELVAALARALPDALILLIGDDSAKVGDRLSACPNVEMVGEVPYARLPFYLHAFDVCMLPFKVVPLTLATNPVKIYEYLAARRPVVAVDLPEMVQFQAMVDVASDHDGFIDAVRLALARAPEPGPCIARRGAFAAAHTWEHRARVYRDTIESLPRPAISVIVLTYNNLALTKACLESLDTHCHDVDAEIIVVDNASSDGTPAFLSSWAASRPNVRTILNPDNRGFAAGNNQGLAAATGDYLVILNNDTVVTEGWARRMVNHLRDDPAIGILGPVTNNIGNEAKIDTAYTSLEAMHGEAGLHTARHLGMRFEIRAVAFFCVMLPRTTYTRCGPLSEDYGLGFFEDDDYCRRVQNAGLSVTCAEDVFVHHQLSASFNQLGAEKKRALFEKNRATYESKWGPWTPHAYRSTRAHGCTRP